MLKLTNILDASGLGKAEQAELEALLDTHSSVATRNKILLDYYEGDADVPDIGISAIPDTVNIKECCSWPKKAVTSVSERSRFDGFVSESGEKNDILERVVRDNALIGSYNRHAPSELLHGCMFATVGRIEKATSTVGYGKRPIAARFLRSKRTSAIRFHTAETAAAIWDSSEGRIGSGFVIANIKRTEWSPNTPVPVQVNMHCPGEVIVLRRHDATKWVAEHLPTPLDRPMMESFAFRATGVKPFGESRISKTVMSLTDDVRRTLANMAISGEFYAFPQKYLLGLTDEQYDELIEDKWGLSIGAMLLSTRDEEGHTPSFGQLPASSPEPYIAMLRTYATLFSAATGVPVSSLGIIQDNPSSAEAISSAREDICIAADDLNQSSAESLRNVALMAMAVAENKRIDELSDEQQSVMAHFKDPSMPSVVSQADAAVKIASADKRFASTDAFYEMLGFDTATIARIKSDKSKARASEAIASLISPKEEDGGDTTEPS